MTNHLRGALIGLAGAGGDSFRKRLHRRHLGDKGIKGGILAYPNNPTAGPLSFDPWHSLSRETHQ